MSIGTRTKKVAVAVLMSCPGALCLLLLPPLIPDILFPDPDRFIALALHGREPKPDHPILPPPEFQRPSPSNRLPYAASPPPPPSPAGSPHFETYRLGRKLIAIWDYHPPSPPPLMLDCSKAPPSNPPPPPPPPPSPAASPHFKIYRLGRKLIAIGDCYLSYRPPLIVDRNKAPASNAPSLLLLLLNSSLLVAVTITTRKISTSRSSSVDSRSPPSPRSTDVEFGASTNVAIGVTNAFASAVGGSSSPSCGFGFTSIFGAS